MKFQLFVVHIWPYDRIIPNRAAISCLIIYIVPLVTSSVTEAYKTFGSELQKPTLFVSCYCWGLHRLMDSQFSHRPVDL